jgi:glutamine synthetase
LILNPVYPTINLKMANTVAVSTVQDFFDGNPDVLFVRFVVVDHGSVLRVSVMPRKATLQVAAEGYFNTNLSVFAVGITVFDTANMEALQVGVDKIVPDWATLKVCSFYPSHAIIMCVIREAGKAEASDDDDDDDAFGLCPRSILAKQVLRAQQAVGQDILVGLEIEFLLYKPGASDFTRPATAHANFNSTFLYDENLTRVLDDIAQTLARADIDILKYHPEGMGPGIFEIALPPYGPLQAADAAVYCRGAIKTVARRHGYEATMCPFPFEKGNLYQCLQASVSVSDPTAADYFLSGVLGSLAGIGAFAMPSVLQSDRRLACTASRQLASWGYDNKSCAVRERRPGLWEMRFSDAAMNPYLTFAAVIAAGVAGIESRRELTVKPVPHMLDPLKISKDELGITDSIPDSLEGRLARLADDEVLKAALGSRVLNEFVGLKRSEIETASRMTVTEINDRLRLIF